jgi:hypothetical protein
MPGYHHGRPPRNKGMRYPADPPTIEEIVAVMRAVGERPDGLRLRALIVLLWRAGLRIGEALALAETDVDRSRGAVLVRRRKGGKRREVGMDRWAWQQLDPWLQVRSTPASRRAVVCDPRPDRRAALGTLGGSQTAPPRRGGRGRPAPLRPAPAPARPRDRDGPRGHPSCCYPAPTRACEPRDHVRLPPKDRQLRDHRNRPLTSGTDDQRHSGPRASVAERAAGRPTAPGGTPSAGGERDRDRPARTVPGSLGGGHVPPRSEALDTQVFTCLWFVVWAASSRRWPIPPAGGSSTS